MIKAVLFDLDGTLLPMDLEEFLKEYMGLLSAHMAKRGYEPRRFIATVMGAVENMVKNDGAKLNCDLFWETAVSVYGQKTLEDMEYCNTFYKTDFNKLKDICPQNPQAKATLDSLKEKGLRLILATNPLFPAAATENRVRWAGIDPEVFELRTTYENSRFSKPNPCYYRDILEKAGLLPEECIMVGNDVEEDMVAAKVGIDVFLLTDFLINRSKTDINRFPHGSYAELNEYLEKKCR